MAGAAVVKDLGTTALTAGKELLESSGAYRSIEHNLTRTEEGKDVLGLFKNYRQKQDQVFTQLHTQATNDFNNGKLLQLPESNELVKQSRVTARSLAFGEKDKALTFLVNQSHKNNGHIATQNLMDNIAMYLHEDQTIEGEQHRSVFKQRAKQTIEKNDPRYAEARKFAKENDIPLHKALSHFEVEQYSSHSDYRSVGDKERKIRSFIYNRFSPLIAIPHLGTILNTVQSTQTSSLIKALAETTSPASLKELKEQHAASGVFAEDALRNMRAIEEARNGVISKYLPGSLQNILGKVTTTPGFNYVRDWQIAFTASASYHDAIDYASKYARGEKREIAEFRLKQYGMNNEDLATIRDSGKLNPDQLERVVWHGVDKKIFLDTSLHRAYMAQSNPWARAFNMYHGYVSSQAQFMKNEIGLAMRTKDPLIVAKAVAVMGVLFPAAGESLKMLEMVGRGQFSQIHKEMDDDEKGITLQQGDSIKARATHFIGTYTDALAHLGAFGIAFELIQGAQRGMLLEQMAGPLVGSGLKYLQDTVQQSARFLEDKPVNTSILGRDALEAGIPYGIGRYLKHSWFPTKKEQEAEKKAGSLHKLKQKGAKRLSYLK